MRRLALLAALASLASCNDFQKLIDDCDAHLGPCAPEVPGDAGTDAGADADAGTDAGADPGFGEIPLAPGGVTSDCAGAGHEVAVGSARGFCFEGFTWLSPLPQGNELRAVWGRTPQDLWAGGQAGMLMHFDGATWTNHQGEISPVLEGSIEALTGGPEGLLAAAVVNIPTGESLFSRSDAGWAVVDVNQQSVHALAFNPVTNRVQYLTQGAVGAIGGVQSGVPGSGEVNGWGRVGTVVSTADGGCVASYWSSSSCVFVDCLGNLLGTIVSPNGACGLWPQGNELRGLSDGFLFELLPDAGWGVVGGFTGPSNDLPLAVSTQPDGTGVVVGENRALWRLPGRQNDVVGVDTVPGRRFDLSLMAVWHSADGGSMAVGRGGFLARQTSSAGGPFLWHSGGATQDFYALLVETTRELIVGRDGFALVGGQGVAAGGATVRDLMRRADGGYLRVDEGGEVRTWNPPAAPQPAYGVPRDGGDVTLNGLFGFDDEDVVAVGHGQGHGVIVTWDGALWRDESVDAGELWKVHGRRGRAWVVGNDGLMLERLAKGQPFRRLPQAGNQNLYAVWMASADAGTGWAVGGNIVRLSGGEVVNVEGAPGSLFDVWGFDESDLWAVGANGLVFRNRGNGWVQLEVGTRNTLERVRGRRYADGSREVFLVGEFGTVLRYRYTP